MGASPTSFWRGSGPSPPPVLARVQRPSKEGYILELRRRGSIPLKLGAGMMVFVEVLLDKHHPNVFEAFSRRCRCMTPSRNAMHGGRWL